MHDFFKSTPVAARWLVDADHKCSSDVIDLVYEDFASWRSSFMRGFYHRGVKDRVHDLCYYRVPDSPLEHPFFGPEVPNFCYEHQEMLFAAVRTLREDAQKAGANLEFFFLSNERSLKVAQEYIKDPEMLNVRRFMLEVVGAVLCGGFSYEGAAERFGVNLFNVKLWVGVFLNHGPSAFLRPPAKLHRQEEHRIAFEHIRREETLLRTAIRYGFLNKNRMMRILLHYHGR